MFDRGMWIKTPLPAKSNFPPCKCLEFPFGRGYNTVFDSTRDCPFSRCWCGSRTAAPTRLCKRLSIGGKTYHEKVDLVVSIVGVPGWTGGRHRAAPACVFGPPFRGSRGCAWNRPDRARWATTARSRSGGAGGGFPLERSYARRAGQRDGLSKRQPRRVPQ